MTTFTLTITFDGDAPNATYSRLGTVANDLQNEFENARVSLEAETTTECQDPDWYEMIKRNVQGARFVCSNSLSLASDNDTRQPWHGLNNESNPFNPYPLVDEN